MLIGAITKSIFEASIFEKSRISLMTISKCSPEACAIDKSSCCASFKCSSCSRVKIPSTPFIGVRSSWLILAIKSDFTCNAVNASSRAFCICAVRWATSFSSPSLRLTSSWFFSNKSAAFCSSKSSACWREFFSRFRRRSNLVICACRACTSAFSSVLLVVFVLLSEPSIKVCYPVFNVNKQ